MKAYRVIISTVCAVSFAGLIMMFLALHDIYKDYMSPLTLKTQMGDIPDSLPVWTTCSGEWMVIRVMLPVVALLQLSVIVFLLYRGPHENSQRQ